MHRETGASAWPNSYLLFEELDGSGRAGGSEYFGLWPMADGRRCQQVASQYHVETRS